MGDFDFLTYFKGFWSFWNISRRARSDISKFNIPYPQDIGQYYLSLESKTPKGGILRIHRARSRPQGSRLIDIAYDSQRVPCKLPLEPRLHCWYSWCLQCLSLILRPRSESEWVSQNPFDLEVLPFSFDIGLRSLSSSLVLLVVISWTPDVIIHSLLFIIPYGMLGANERFIHVWSYCLGVIERFVNNLCAYLGVIERFVN